MRVLLKFTIPVDRGNHIIRDGSLGESIKTILDEIKPEAAYFTADKGERGGFLVAQLNDASEIPKLAEPFFLAFDAKVEIHPVMTAQDLAKAAPHMAEAVKRFGHKGLKAE